jgi:hypothetical protein
MWSPVTWVRLGEQISMTSVFSLLAEVFLPELELVAVRASGTITKHLSYMQWTILTCFGS